MDAPVSAGNDLTESLHESVAGAVCRRQAIIIAAGHTKSFLPHRQSRKEEGALLLDMSGHSGIIHYDPAELVLTARAGTLLRAIEAELVGQGQMLAFEPPHFGEQATLGGTIACGLSGPRRPFAGSVRDSVLGCKIINGKGEVLSFGGRLMKNVAGFDVSRLMAGAMGTLGILLEVSLKVIPRPQAERTLVYAMTLDEALTRMNLWSGQPWPISAVAHDGSWTWLRLSGHDEALTVAQTRLGGDLAADGPLFWRQLREQQSRFFRYPALGQRLWRLSLAPASPIPDLPGNWFHDWAGALRWLRSDAPAEDIFRAAGQAGGHATLFRGECPDGPFSQPLTDPLGAIHRQIKRAFDPHGLLNPGGMNADF